MKVHSGGLMAYLNSRTQEQAAAVNVVNSDQDVITHIDVHDLVRNERNFYGIRDVEELASLIAASGVVEPLTVTPLEGGKYRIIAGERRASATLLRLQRGDLIDPKVPCIIKVFNPSGSLDASDMEMLYLIASNRGQRQTRTALEKLREIEELEPIAKKIFQDENIQGTFRRFFAQDILSMSPAQLQRLKTLTNLVPNAQKALEMQILSDTAAMELATHTEDEQGAYLQALVEDNIQTRVRDIKEFFGTQQEMDPTDNEFEEEEDKTVLPAFCAGQDGDYPASAGSVDRQEMKQSHPESGVEAQSDEREGAAVTRDVRKNERKKREETDSSNTNAIINIDVPIPKDMNGEQMEHEADTWIETILLDSIRIADEKTKEAREAGETRIAALWDSRRAKAVLVLETVRE